MSEDYQIAKDLAAVAECAAKAKGVAYRCHERLIELSGVSGQDGVIGRLRKDVIAMRGQIDAVAEVNARQEQELAAMRTERSLMARSGLYGASAGGGAILLVAELLRHFFGG